MPPKRASSTKSTAAKSTPSRPPSRRGRLPRPPRPPPAPAKAGRRPLRVVPSPSPSPSPSSRPSTRRPPLGGRRARARSVPALARLSSRPRRRSCRPTRATTALAASSTRSAPTTRLSERTPAVRPMPWAALAALSDHTADTDGWDDEFLPGYASGASDDGDLF